MLKLTALCALCALAAPVAAADYYEGSAYSPRDGSLLYRESHWTRRSGAAVQRIALFRCPDGRPFARRVLDESAGAAAPDFSFEDARDGYREGLRSQGGQRVVYASQPDGSQRATPIAMPAGAVADAGFDARIQALWPRLVAGETVPVPFLIPSRQAFYRFRAVPETAGPDHGELRVRLRMDAWYAFAVPDIELVYDAASRRLSRFSGLSTIRDESGRYRQVRVRFPAAPAAPPMDAAGALAAPLAKSCGA